MTQKIFTTLFISAIFFVSALKAQTKKDTKDTSKTVIIFNSNSTGNVKKGSPVGNSIIKIDPLGFIFGKIPFAYEQKITDLLAIQASVGLTSKNYLREAWESASTDPSSDITYDASFPANFQDETDPLYSYEHRKPAMGYMFSLQPRLYFNEDALEGSFLGLGLNFTRYNFTTPGLVQNPAGSFTGPTKKEYENIKDLVVYYGYQRLYNRISLEYSSGIGLRKVNGVKYVAGANGSSFYDALAGYTRKSTVTFDVSFKLGFQL